MMHVKTQAQNYKHSYLVQEGTDVVEREGQGCLVRRAAYRQSEFITAESQVMQRQIHSHLHQWRDPLD